MKRKDNILKSIYSKIFSSKSAIVNDFGDKTNTNYPKNFMSFSSGNTELFRITDDKHHASINTLITLYENIADINGIIQYIAQTCSEIEIKHYKGKRELKDSDVVKLLTKELIQASVTQFLLTGNIFTKKTKPVGFDFYSKLNVIDSSKMYVIMSRAINNEGMLPQDYNYYTGEVQKYHEKLDNVYLPYLPDEIVHIKDTTTSGKLYGTSRLFPAIINSKSLRYTYETIMNVLSKGGARGFIKRKKTAGEFQKMMDTEERERLELAFKRYGSTGNKEPWIFTDEDLSVEPLMQDIAKFIPTDISDIEKKAIATALSGFPLVLLDASETTFTNLDTAQKILYINVAIPILNVIIDGYAKGLLKENESFKLGIESIDVLKNENTVLIQSSENIKSILIDKELQPEAKVKLLTMIYQIEEADAKDLVNNTVLIVSEPQTVAQ